MESKLTEEHYQALREAVFPMQFHKNKEGLKKTLLVREVMDFIKNEVIKPDSEIAAELQSLTKCSEEQEWVNDSGEIFTWTDKGFVPTGGYRWKTFKKAHPIYCRCAYPKKNITNPLTTCDGCNKQIL